MLSKLCYSNRMLKILLDNDLVLFFYFCHEFYVIDCEFREKTGIEWEILG